MNQSLSKINLTTGTADFSEDFALPGRSTSLSAQIISEVRQAVLDRRLTVGDALGTEKELAELYGVSRMVTRDALRSLQAMGIAEIKMGKGGGARIARGNPRLIAEALAIQFDLTGVGADEVIDAQRAIECMAAELAAEKATEEDHTKIRRLLNEADKSISKHDDFTRLCRAFHFAVAEASHNRVLVTQLISLDHVAWPLRNKTMTPEVACRIMEVHEQLTDLIVMRDAVAARHLMDDHIKMIRLRRVSEQLQGDAGRECC